MPFDSPAERKAAFASMALRQRSFERRRRISLVIGLTSFRRILSRLGINRQPKPERRGAKSVFQLYMEASDPKEKGRLKKIRKKVMKEKKALVNKNRRK